MNKLSLATVSLIFAAFALPSFAQEQGTNNDEMRPYLSVNYDQVFTSRYRNTESSGPGYSLSAGMALNKYWGVELGGFYDQFNAEPGSATRTDQWRSYGGNLDGLFFYSRDRAFSPYTVLSAGVIHNDLKTAPGASVDNPFGAAGVGFMKYFKVGDHDLGLRADVRYRWEGTRDLPGYRTYGEPVVKVGLVIPLGARPAEAVASSANNTANAPRQAAESGANRTFENVHFAFDKSYLTGYSRAILDNASNVINGLSEKYPNVKVEISGHTDWIGSEGYNQALSERRADAVKSYLSRKGVEAKRIQTHAYGENKPVAPNTTAEGRALNRRAEVRTHD